MFKLYHYIVILSILSYIFLKEVNIHILNFTILIKQFNLIQKNKYTL